MNTGLVKHYYMYTALQRVCNYHVAGKLNRQINTYQN